MGLAAISSLHAGERFKFRILAGICLIGLLQAPLHAATNAMDQIVLHPAIPLLDEAGDHVLDSGKPYSSKTTCGTAGCHDYDSITHAFHIEQGRDEASDDFGRLRGQPQLVSPGYFGGYNCMGGSNPDILAKLKNNSADDFADYGSAGIIMRCISCHSGGGWMEKDRNGRRYDETDPASVSAFDGDYFNRGSDENNQPASSDTVTQWDWQKSGVIENDCLMCHTSFTDLKKFDPQLGANDGADGTSDAKDHFTTLRTSYLAKQGLFRYVNTAILEFINLNQGEGQDRSVVTFARNTSAHGPVHTSTKPTYALNLDGEGQPSLNWNTAAFDANRKVTIPMLRFPTNDNCMLCHRTSNSRRGFYGFGEGAEATFAEADGTLIEDYQDDVHKGKTWTEANGEERAIENCNACHTRNYYNPAHANVDLDASHNFLKGNSDMDVRNDLDYGPNAKSCEYCHDEAENPAIPSGQDDMLGAHLERWKHNGDMAGYPQSALERVTQTHLDVVSCQACHINGKKSRGRPINPLYRYRQAENGDLTIVPYNPRTRYYWKDKNSGRVLNKTERNSVFQLVQTDTETYGLIVDPVSGAELAQVSARMSHGSWRFGEPEGYSGFLALKRAYDKLLQLKGVQNPDAVMVWTESNEYLMSHNTRPAVSSAQCAECHSKKQDGSFSALLSTEGLFGEANSKSVTTLADPRLIREGLVILDMPYMKTDDSGEVTVNVSDILYETRIDPSMSVLRAARASQVSGIVQRRPVENVISDANIANAADVETVRQIFGNREVFVYRPNYGDTALRNTALLAEINGQSEWLYPAYRFQAALAADASVSQLPLAGEGALVSPVISLQARDTDGKAVSRFDSARLLVKLPYNGSSIDRQQVRVMTLPDGGDWTQIDSANVIALQAQSSTADGYVLFWTSHFSDFAVTDAALGVSTPSTSGSSDSQAPSSGGGAGFGLVLLSAVALFRRRRKS